MTENRIERMDNGNLLMKTRNGSYEVDVNTGEATKLERATPLTRSELKVLRDEFDERVYTDESWMGPTLKSYYFDNVFEEVSKLGAPKPRSGTEMFGEVQIEDHHIDQVREETALWKQRVLDYLDAKIGEKKDD